MNTTSQSSSTVRLPQVGDVLVAEWGYEQTNIDFYRVVAVTKASVKIRPLTVVKRPDGYETGTAVPGDETFGMMKTRRFTTYTRTGNKPFTTVTSYAVKADNSVARLWDGTPQRYTSWY